MTAQLSAIFGAGTQLFNNQGVILAGGKITTYQAGTTILATTWTTSDQSVANANPIILDSAGRVPNEVWLASGISYKFVLVDSNNNAIGTWDYIPGISNAPIPGSEWVSGFTPTYISATSFSVTGNQTLFYTQWRRVQYVLGSGTFYGMVTSSSYDGVATTTVNIIPDSTSMDNTLTAVNYGFLSTFAPSALFPYYSSVSIPTAEFGKHRNRTINGQMLVDQRNKGALQTITAGALTYCIDKFYVISTGANVTGQQTSDSFGSSSLHWAYQINGAASVTSIIFGHRYESKMVQDLAFGTVSFSVDLASNTVSTVTWKAFYANSLDNFSSKTQFATGTFTGLGLYSVISRFYASFGMSGNTIPTSNGICIELSVGAMTSGSLYVANWQLEQGSGFSPIEPRPYGLELELCQRYYFRSFPSVNAATIMPNAWATASTTAIGAIQFPATMRAAPTAVEQTGTATDYRVNIAGTATACSSVPTFSAATANSGKVTFTVASGLTAGQAGEIICAAASSAGYIGFSADL